MDKRISGHRQQSSTATTSSKRSVTSKRKAPTEVIKKTYVCLGCNESFDCFTRPQQFIRSHHYGPNGRDKCKKSLHCCILCEYKALREHDINTHYGAKSNRDCCIANNKNAKTLNHIDTANASGMNIGHGPSNYDHVLHSQSFQPFVSNDDYNMHVSRFSEDQSMSFECEEVLDTRKKKTARFLKPSMNNDHSSGDEDMESSDDESTEYFEKEDHLHNNHTSNTAHVTKDVSLSHQDVNLMDPEHVSQNSLSCLLSMNEIMDKNEKSMSKNQWFVAGVELKNILSNANVPLHVTEELFSWAIKHKDNLPSRMSSELKRDKIYK